MFFTFITPFFLEKKKHKKKELTFQRMNNKVKLNPKYMNNLRNLFSIEINY